MHFDISSPGTLKGTVLLPGDRDLTLTTLAFGMLFSEDIYVTHVSPSPDVELFVNFLKNCGAEVENTNGAIKLRGKKWDNTVRINESVPDSIIHCVIGSAVFSTHTVIIEEGAGSRALVTGPLVDLLKTVGLSDGNITVEGNDIIIGGAVFSPPDTVDAGSAWAFESVAAAACSVRKTVSISYPAQIVTQSLRLLVLLGCDITNHGKDNSGNHELSRRLARAGSGKTNEIRKFEWTGGITADIKIPGDSTMAAAVCGAAALLQRSKVTLKGVVWERGRRGFFESLRRMKIEVENEPDKKSYSFDSADIRIKWSKREGIHLSSEQAETMLSELLVLGSVAACATGKTVINDAVDIPLYRRDFYKVLAKGLEMLGAHAGDFSEGMVFHGVQELKGNPVDSGGEAGVALALAVAGLTAVGTTTVNGFGAEDYPVREFLRIIKHLSSVK